ncbi:zinc finger protein 37 homolog [Maniola jurtina]|uniref:zinc finger protein 37 homolog n=1 Tax=Maniola jurtina TaxID=191418 RepID=UPI001E68BF8A|nr:zinc finger protein 37 homolog [Maniola jurtina]XP_045776233.1 zinc finger protein 37 homolog [Maniola jurtina]
MRCFVPFCKNTSDNVTTSEGDKRISFHRFPSEMHLRVSWLRALGKQDNLPDTAVVCSQHFLNEDIYETESGLRQIGPGAIPSTVQVCVICLDTDSKLFLMGKHKLKDAYEKLTGHPLCDQGNLKQTLCVQCVHKLINFSRFREKSLRARALMMDLVEKHELITRRHIKMINRTKHQLKSNMVMTMLEPDHCDLHILENISEDGQPELEETRQIIVKNEDSDDSMSVDEVMEVINEYDNFTDSVKEEFVASDDDKSKDDDVDGECDTSLVCNPHTAAISSSSHSSLITENRQADSSSPALAAQASVAPLSARLATDNEDKEPENGYTDAVRESNPIFEIDNDEIESQTSDISCKRNININKLTNCIVKLYDVFKSPMKCVNRNIASKDISYHATSQNEVPTREHVEPVINAEKVIVSKTFQSKMCKRKSLLVKHIKTHAEVTWFTCKICQYKCKYQSRLKRHMRIHTDVKPFTCKLCDYKSAYNSSLVRHMRTHTGEKPFICTLCDYKCAQNNHLVRHMRTHTGEKPHYCKLCKYKSATKGDLVSHMRTHTGEKPFNCKLCKYKSATKGNLVIHMRTHTGEKPFNCKLCKYKCAKNSGLVTHMRTHTGEKPYFCKICEYKCSYRNNLIEHMRTHTSEKPFNCTLCDYKSAQNGSLVKHMRTHTGEKPFICGLCDFKSVSNSNLVAHMRTHTGEKPHYCKLCKYKSARNSGLVNHMRTHTGEKPFICTLCDYKSAHKISLVKHMRAHTGETSSPYS